MNIQFCASGGKNRVSSTFHIWLPDPRLMSPSTYSTLTYNAFSPSSFRCLGDCSSRLRLDVSSRPWDSLDGALVCRNTSNAGKKVIWDSR